MMQVNSTECHDIINMTQECSQRKLKEQEHPDNKLSDQLEIPVSENMTDDKGEDVIMTHRYDGSGFIRKAKLQVMTQEDIVERENLRRTEPAKLQNFKVLAKNGFLKSLVKVK